MNFYSLLVAEFSTFRRIGHLQHIKCSHGLVGVEHDSDQSTHGVGSDVLLEADANNTGMTVGVDDFAPGASITSVVK